MFAMMVRYNCNDGNKIWLLDDHHEIWLLDDHEIWLLDEPKIWLMIIRYDCNGIKIWFLDDHKMIVRWS